MKSIDGVASKGKTKGKQLGIDGATVTGLKGSNKGGVSQASLKAVGRNKAKIKNQGK